MLAFSFRSDTFGLSEVMFRDDHHVDYDDGNNKKAVCSIFKKNSTASQISKRRNTNEMHTHAHKRMHASKKKKPANRFMRF